MKDVLLISKDDKSFEEFKNSLVDEVSKYKSIVVTEDNVKDSKKMASDIAKYRNEIEAFRKKRKSEMEEPIKLFDSKCKELIEIVKESEAGLKAGIKVFDDKRRDAKREFALNEIDFNIKEYSLEPDFAKLIVLKDKYLTLSVTNKSVRDDVRFQALSAREKQENYHNKLNAINSTLEAANKDILTKIKLEDLDLNKNIDQIITTIQTKKFNIQLAEQKAAAAAEKRALEAEQKAKIEAEKAAAAEQRATEAEQKVKNVVCKKEPDNVPLFSYTMEITGSKTQLLELNHFLENNSIKNEVLSRKRV